MRMTRLALVAAVLLSAGPTHAGVFVDDLSRCLAATSTPADHNVLMRWMFAAFAKSPSIQDLAKVSSDQREDGDTKMARLVERLLSENCRKEVVQAVKAEGNTAIETSFGVLGGLASRRLMASPEAETAIGNFATKLDVKKLEFISKEAGQGNAAGLPK